MVQFWPWPHSHPGDKIVPTPPANTTSLWTGWRLAAVAMAEATPFYDALDIIFTCSWMILVHWSIGMCSSKKATSESMTDLWIAALLLSSSVCSSVWADTVYWSTHCGPSLCRWCWETLSCLIHLQSVMLLAKHTLRWDEFKLGLLCRWWITNKGISTDSSDIFTRAQCLSAAVTDNCIFHMISSDVGSIDRINVPASKSNSSWSSALKWKDPLNCCAAWRKTS